MTLDTVCIGNAIIDAFLQLQDSDTHLSVDKQKKTLTVGYGEKILLSGCEFHLGGNACNVSVGLRRLGLTSSLMAEIAMDEFSAKILNGLRKEEVNTDYLIRNDGQSSFTVGINYQGERTLFVEHKKREHPFSLAGLSPRSLYLTSLGQKWEHVYKEVATFKREHPDVLLAFNPGSVQYKEGVEKFSFLFPLTDILFVNKDEAERIVGQTDSQDGLLTLLQEKGIKTVVITDGENGSRAIDETGKIVTQGIIPCNVVERTGAGDSFATAFLAARLQGEPVETALRAGAYNSSSVIEHIGSQPGLLTKEQMQEKIQL